MPTAGQRLRALAAAREPATIQQVIERMRALTAAFPRGDGVAWFNELYLEVTRTVADALQPRAFRRPEFVARLDVVFAGLYFAALDAALHRPTAVPRSWAPLLEARARRNVAPIQFALAGMNAHINRDLPVALVRTCTELRIDLETAAPEHVDYTAVNPLLARTEARVKRRFSKGILAVADELLGSLDDRIAIWDVGRAREAAWVNARTLWALRAVPPLQHAYLEALDRSVGFAGRGILLPLR
jgi:Family of unknown function (DUF5995)